MTVVSGDMRRRVDRRRRHDSRRPDDRRPVHARRRSRRPRRHADRDARRRSMATAHVRVLGATEVPATVTLSPAASRSRRAGTVPFTVTLDIPAPAGGTSVDARGRPARGHDAGDRDGRRRTQLSATFTYTDAGDAARRRRSPRRSAAARRRDRDGHDRREPPRDQRGRLRQARHRHRRVRRDLQPVGGDVDLDGHAL